MAATELTKADFQSDQETRWCPGCGDYAVLYAVQGFFPELGIPPERVVFVSGIGCAGRFAYYMDTYGMHGIHGRGPALATGLAAAREDLSIWVVTGDGDALSIGGNHLIHALRRNVPVKILLFNNQIYGLTKGQASPTSERGKVTKSTPFGSIDAPFNPVSLALGAEASFVARTIDTDKKHLPAMLRAAAEHEGAALVEIYQNCPVFNDGAFDALRDKKRGAENRIELVHGEPIRGVTRDPDGSLRLGDDGEPVIHDAHREDPSFAFALSRLSLTPDGPTPVGIFRDVKRPVWNRDLPPARRLDESDLDYGAQGGRYVDDRRLDRHSAKWAAYPPDVLPAWVAEMDFPLAEPVKAALREAVERDDTGYLGPELLGVPDALAEFAARRLGWDVDPEQVVVATDVMVGVEECLRVLTDPGAGVVITPPVYPPFFADIRHAGREVVEAPLADGRFDVAAIERAFEAGAQAILLCNPHNPLGRVWSRGELAAIADLAGEHGAWVLSDEIHGPLTRAYTPILTLSDRAVALTSASKAFNLAGLKLGLIVTAGGEARDRIAPIAQDAHWRAGYLGAVGAEAAFREGDEWLDDVLARLEDNRRLLGELLAEHLPGVVYDAPEASFLAWLDCRALGLGEDPAATFLERGRVALSRGLDFGAQGAGYARLNIGTDPERIEEAVTRMAAALSR